MAATSIVQSANCADYGFMPCSRLSNLPFRYRSILKFSGRENREFVEKEDTNITVYLVQPT